MAPSLLTVSWKDHPSELSTVCKNLLAEDFLVDCTIAAEGQKLKAHRLILSACSPYFQMLFNEETEKHPMVILKDTLFDTLKAVIDFVYHGEIQIPDDQLQAFLQLAESLQIKGLNNSLPLPYPKGGHEDAVQSNSFVSFEGQSVTCEEVHLASVVRPPHEQQIILGSDDQSLDAEMTMKQEPLCSVFLETNTEVFDDIQNDEPMSRNFVSEMGEGTTTAFGEKDLNQSSREAVDFDSRALRTQPPQQQELAQTLTGKEMHCSSSDPFSEPQPRALARSHKCSECGKSFRQKAQFSCHMHSHIDERPYSCDECGLSFREANGLNDHRIKHMAVRPFRCDDCGASFAQRSNLKTHQRKHTGERPFSCNECGLSFRQANSLHHHASKHTGMRPFRCDMCEASFTQTGDLKRHKRKHTGERPYRCDVCGFFFKEAWDLKCHRRTHRSAETP